MDSFDLQVCHIANLDLSDNRRYPNVAGKFKKQSAISSQLSALSYSLRLALLLIVIAALSFASQKSAEKYNHNNEKLSAES